MALESATHLNQLVSTNPTGSDQKAQGDDHIRMLKAVLQTDFPAITGPVTATQAELNILDGATVTAAELNHSVGVTSPIQTQIDAKAPAASPTLTGTVTVSGGQIAFPATQNASANANTLDDYEEGTWTPDLKFGGAAVGITYDSRAGKYIKIGYLVIASFDLDLSSKGSSTGNATIEGLPFSMAAFNVAAVPFQFYNTAVACITVFGTAGVGTVLSLQTMKAAGTSPVSFADTDAGNDLRLRGTVIYFV